MKKTLLFITLALFLIGCKAFAQEDETPKAKIVFEKEVHDFGKFPETEPKVSCVFTFKNEGNAPLVIHQVVTSCGCTVPEYPKKPINPGEGGSIIVSYNGAGKYPGQFRKSIRVRTNGEPDLVTLYIKGEMTEVSVMK